MSPIFLIASRDRGDFQACRPGFGITKTDGSRAFNALQGSGSGDDAIRRHPRPRYLDGGGHGVQAEPGALLQTLQ
jgi:hypothetical protein